jgi:hypothetical protein
MGDNKATFKHVQQVLAVEFIASINPSILLVGLIGMSPPLKLKVDG